MAEVTRKPILDRMAALVAGPFLLGRRALSLDWVHTEDSPPEPRTEPPVGMTVTPPEHAIKRRG